MAKERETQSPVSRSEFKEEEMAKETEVGPRGKEAPKKVSRREFVKGAAVGAAGIAAAGALASCAPAATPTTAPVATAAPTPTTAPVPECPPCPTPGVPEKWDYEADVVIVGFGAGGSAAAIEAHDAGAKVLILEKLDEQGGSIRRCGGGILGAGTAVQKALGVEDSPDRLYEYLMLCWGKSNVDLERIRILADNAGKNVDWVIQDLGADMPWELSESGIIPGLNSTCEMFAAPPGYVPQAPRSHWMNPAPGYEEKGWRDGMVGGTGLFKPFDEAIKKRQIESLLETPLVGLVADANREVLGVKAESGGTILYIKARRGVFLGTGGWRNNVKMLRDYHPGGQEAIEGAFVTEPNPSIYSLHEDGSGVIAAQAIGADLANMGQLDSTMFHCDGGLRINNKAQVIDVYGQVIPRLYASGCISGGTFGEYYPGCGTYVTVAVCFGRIGGQNVAAEEPWV